MKDQRNGLFRSNVMARKRDLTFVRVCAKRVRCWVRAVVRRGLPQISAVAGAKDPGTEEPVL